MGKRKCTTEQIIVKLRKIEVLCGQGKTIAEAVRQAEISEQTYYRWRKTYDGMNASDARADHPCDDRVIVPEGL